MTRLSYLGCIALLLLAACGPSTPGAEEPGGDPFDPHNLYPLADGHVWSYNVDTGTGEPTLAITKVISHVGARVEVTSGGDPVVYEIRDEGIFRPGSGTWLLRAPVREGSEWPSSGGMTARVTSTQATVETPGGTFEGCVRVEESGGEGDRYVQTVYCPGIGPVYLESRMTLTTSEMPVRVIANMLGYNLGGAEDL